MAARLLEAAGFLKLKLVVGSSSHGRKHSPQDAQNPRQARRFLNDSFPRGTISRAWGGLICGGVQYPHKRNGPHDFKPDSCSYKEAKTAKDKFDAFSEFIKGADACVALQVSMSNDFKVLNGG